MNKQLLPASETRTEITVVNSRFISTIAPVLSVSEAKEFISRIKTEFSDASHNVPAFVIGHGTSVIAHCSDDGEPSGTAGRPALTVLQGSGLGDAAVVVTRYFGGTKLGKGGLVRAYGDAVRVLLKKISLAEKVTTKTIMLAFPYNYYDQLQILFRKHHATIHDQEFAGDVTITCKFRQEDLPCFQYDLTMLTHGTIQAIIVETNDTAIMLVDSP